MDGPKSLTRREALVAVAYASGAIALSGFATGADKQSTRTIPAVPGKLAIE